jgi:hypothetical protein
MKKIFSITLISILVVITLLSSAAYAFSTPDSIVAAGKVYVSSTTYDPEVFFPGDTGTVTFVVMNGNADTGVVINHATLIDKNIKLRSSTYDSSSNIGPGQSQSFTFSVSADGGEGMYYPEFSISFRDANSLFSRQMVQIDSTPLVISVVDKPDAFAAGKKKTLYLQVANPRKNGVKNAMLDISGDGLTATPSTVFIGDIAAGAKIPVNFSVTPDKETIATLTLSYDNGDNPHVVTMALPLEFGENKKQADPVISNIQIKQDAGIYHITGDINNAGLETANTVIVTSMGPAVPQDPYKSYVVGALKPDDFGSFEVTFTATNTTSIPLQVSYKDVDGNVYNTLQDVKIASTTTGGEKTGSSNLIPVIGIIAVIVIVFVGGWVVYLRRNKK